MKNFLKFSLNISKSGGKYFVTLCTFLSVYAFSNPPDLSIVGYVKMADGLGRISVEMLNAVNDELNVEFIPTRDTLYEDVPGSLLGIISQNPIVKDTPDIHGKVVILTDFLWAHWLSNYTKLSQVDRNKQITLAYSMLESDRIPQLWVDILNTHFDAVIVPDPFLVSAYANSGVIIPIFTLPIGLDLHPLLETKLKSKVNTPFVFGNLSSCSNRKNLVKLIHGFHKEFNHNPNVKLVINSRPQEEDYERKVQILIRRLKTKNIIFNVNSLNNADYLRLFQTFDCYINVSKGEGFSIQPREAMALGIPTILCNNTAQISICNTNLVKSVPSPHKIRAYYPAIQAEGGSYFDTDSKEIGKAMREVYENYEVYLSHSHQAREWAAEFTPEALKPYYKTIIKPEKVELGSENKITENSLITNSKELYNKYLRLMK